MTWAGPAAVLLVCVATLLRLPASWERGGFVPDAALLATLFVSFRGTGDRAGWFGIVAGLATAPWSAEPPLLRATVLGALGLVAGRAAAIFDRERVASIAAVAGIGGVLMRATAELAAGLPARADAGGIALRVLVAGVVAAIAAPPFFALLRATRVLAPLERSFRDV